MKQEHSDKEPVLRAAGVTLAATLFLWPAFLNRFPLLYPDSLTYLGRSRANFDRLLGRAVPARALDSTRSEIYSASLTVLHRHAMLWPIVAIQALLAAWIVWLTVRTLGFRSPLRVYAAVVAFLAPLSGIAWYVSFLMPDIFGSLLYMALVLLVCAWDRLRRWETVLLGAVSLYAMTAHATHWILAGCLCLLFALCRRLGLHSIQPRRIALVAILVAMAAVAQMAAHEQLYGRPSLFGNPPPFLMARLLGDGPARLYLQQNCPRQAWTICSFRDHLPVSETAFLWAPNGIWESATPVQRTALRREQVPLLLATVRAFPAQQFARSLHNFGESLVSLGPASFHHWDIFTPGALNWAASGLSSRYSGTRQAASAMPQNFFLRLQVPITFAGLAITLLFVPCLWRRNEELALLNVVVLVVFLGNAFLSGVISCNDPRLQGRIAWMPVFTAALCLLARFLPRQGSEDHKLLAGPPADHR
jgi:hypothetical protein